ncbi:zf-HC2 domain-containing protein (plasmid) [Streptomyces sp. NBC_00289]|uniref:zf-HC2 domain-containing protein n=1 Tax=Streptomyces sp. NBC_00289 TaxID=2975703 RepID=UPI002F90C1C1
MSTSPDHHEVAAYVLGILDAAATDAFEEHLTTCPDCALEATQLSETAERLAALATPVNVSAAQGGALHGQGSLALAERQVPVGAVISGPELLQRTLAATAAERRTTKRRRLVLMAAAAAAIIAGPILALNATPGHQAAPSAAATTLPSLTGQAHTTHNLATGVTATAALQPKTWGTAITLQVSGVKGPQTCRLLAVSTDGHARPIGDWRVSAPSTPKPLTVTAATDLSLDQLDHLEVRTAAGQTLATIST